MNVSYYYHHDDPHTLKWALEDCHLKHAKRWAKIRVQGRFSQHRLFLRVKSWNQSRRTKIGGWGDQL